MTLSAKAGVFALNTATGNQSITGVGFQPKIVFFLPAYGTADGVVAHAYTGFGVGISSADRRCMAGNDEDAQGTMDSHRINDNTKCFMHEDPGTTAVLYAADFVSQDADGFTIEITTAPAFARRVGYLALGGSDLTNVKSGEFAGSGAAANQSVTGVGFQPDCVIFFNTSDSIPPESSSSIRNAFGWALSSTARMTNALSAYVSVTTSDTGRRQLTNACILDVNDDGAITGQADFVSMDADGFTINWSDGSSKYFNYIALKGGRYAVGSMTTQTATGNFSNTSLSFTGAAGIFMSICNPASASEVLGLKLSTGFVTSSTDRFVTGATSEDAQADSDADTYQDDGLIYQNYDYAQSVLGAIDFVSWNANGFTLNQTDADPAGNELLYLVIGPTSAPPSRRVFVTHT